MKTIIIPTEYMDRVDNSTISSLIPINTVIENIIRFWVEEVIYPEHGDEWDFALADYLIYEHGIPTGKLPFDLDKVLMEYIYEIVMLLRSYEDFFKGMKTYNEDGVDIRFGPDFLYITVRY